MGLKDKVVIVTGASSGIGAVLAKQLCKEGAHVTIIGRNNEKLSRIHDECEKICKKPVLKILGDITKLEIATKIINDTVKTFGRIDVLVNNAGYGIAVKITDKKAMEAYDSMMNTNIRAVVQLTTLAIPHLAKTKGNIINISSVAGMKPFDNMWAYCTSKAALDHFSKCMAMELAPMGIRVNTINPGPVATDFQANMGLSAKEIEDRKRIVADATLLRRYSDAEEIGELIMFLMSDKARGVTGSCIVSDNGILLSSPKFNSNM